VNASSNDFDFVIDTIEKNYAGFPSKVTGQSLSAYTAHTSALRKSYVGAKDYAEQEELLKAFLSYFNDKHISIQSNSTTPAEAEDTESYPYFEKIDEETVLIRIPSFLPRYYEAINELIQEHHEVLTNTPNLVLDLRGNGGGSDECFSALLPYVCPESINVVGADVRATQGNIEYLRELTKIHEFPEDALSQINDLTELMAKSLGGFVEMVPTQTMPLGEVFAKPQKVAICIDEKCASSTEQFVIFALESPKVTLFGENTAGCIDFSNVVPAQTPSKNWTLFYPISRSKRIPLHQIDGLGIEPHVRLDTESKVVINDVVKHLLGDIH
jgi:C-terminal processing protease CtpA/Prc